MRVILVTLLIFRFVKAYFNSNTFVSRLKHGISLASPEGPRGDRDRLTEWLYNGLKLAPIVVPFVMSSPSIALEPEITHKVYIDFKIANYTEESIGRNRPGDGSGRIVFGLYGNDAPKTVAQFLSLIKGDGETTPSFTKSIMTKVTEEGIFTLDKVRGVNPVTIAGAEQYEFRGTIQPQLLPIIEPNGLSHTQSGLLSHRQFGMGGEFGIALRPNAALDATHSVFGRTLSGMKVLDAVAAIPTYSYKTKTGYGGKEKSEVQGNIADAWFEGQKNFYVGVGKAFGDKRAVDQRGKLLRRVVISACGPVDNS